MPLIRPISVNFGEDGDRDLDCFVFNNVTTLKAAYDDIYTTKIPNWRRIDKGKPKEEKRNFPWEGASNVVIPVVAENVQILKAVQLASIFEILPIWVSGLLGEWKPEEKGEEQRSVYESFMNEMALSKGELDLYRVESAAAHDIAAFGDAVIKVPWETCTEAIVTGISSEDSTKPIYEDKIIYDGPRPEKLDKQDWAASPKANTFKDARFKFHFYSIGKDQVEDKIHKGIFDDNEATRAVLSSPDREGLDSLTEQQLREQNNIGPWQPNKHTAEWDFYECWFWFLHNKIKYRILYTLHLKSKTRMKAVFNFYTDNEEPFEFGRLGYDDDGLLGYGMAEMGEMFQDQVSTSFNQGNDNKTCQNTNVILTGKNSNLDANFAMYPMACLPFEPNNFVVQNLGSGQVVDTTADISMTLALAKARFGTDMGMPSGSGAGAGQSKGKSGPTYNAQGTFSVLQTGTRRININVADFRYMHLGVGNKCGKQYANFGISSEKLKQWGQQAETLKMALENIKNGRINLPIKAATASINREVEKQTGMLFTQVMQRHFGVIAQILGGLQNPVLDPNMKNYLVGSIAAMAFVMSKLLRSFGYDDIRRMQPELDLVEAITKIGANNGQRNIQGGQGPSNGSATEQGVDGSNQPSPANNGNAGQPTVSSSGGVLQ